MAKERSEKAETKRHVATLEISEKTYCDLKHLLYSKALMDQLIVENVIDRIAFAVAASIEKGQPIRVKDV